ncbi:putative ribonuclease H-like domain-containing protein [Tanacetum coccineum]
MSDTQDENPPPPPPPATQQTPTYRQNSHTVSTIKLPILKKGEYDIWAMKAGTLFGSSRLTNLEVIQNGNGCKINVECIKSRFGGNDESKKMQKYILKQQFEGFTVSNSDGIHKGSERFQSLLSQLEIHGAGVSTEDANQNSKKLYLLLGYQSFLIMRKQTPRNGQSHSTNDVSTAHGVSNTSGHYSKHDQTSSYSLLASQSSCPQLDHEDLDQVDEYDLEEMDLKWQVAMISMRIKKFYKKTGRKLQFDAKEPVGFDKTKVECYNCHKTGHFARECRTKEDNRRRDGWNPGNKDGSRTGKKEDSKAMVTVDGECVDWTTHSEDDENYAFMASNSSGSNTQAYTQGLKKVEAQLVAHQQGQLWYEQKIKFMKIDLDDKTDVLTYHKTLLAKAQKEKDDLQVIVDKWNHSSKNLGKIINDHMTASDKHFGLGKWVTKYRYYGNLSYKMEISQRSLKAITMNFENLPLHKRLAKTCEMQAVPPPMTGNYLPSGPDIEIDDSQYHICTEPYELVSEPVVDESYIEVQPKVWSDAPIIEEYKSDSDDEHVCVQTKRLDTPSFANKQVKTPRENVKNQSTHSQKPKVNNKELRHGSTERGCFVCGSFSHLIRDCDYHVKLAKQVELNKQNMSKGKSTGERKPTWNNVQRWVPKSAFLYGKIDEEVYVSQPPGFLDPKYPQKVYKVVKALYGLHQAPRAWYATLSTFLLKNGYRRGTIDKTLFLKKDKHDIILVQVYVDDIIFGSTKKSWCDEFEALMKSRFQMSSMGELTFFLGLQVKQKPDGIFISQDKYVAEILKKFDFANVKTASTPIETQKPLVKDEEANDVDVHLYRSMIGSLMYLTASRPDIMFAVCACSRFQVTPKSSHLSAVKRIFRYLKGKPKLGLWYPRVSSFDLESYSDSDYAGANLDRKSTTRGCQFLGRRLISWQCKKQTIVATSTTEAEYVAAASCCGQVLWIQNQMLDYGFNFMNTKIYIDNESTICIVKNPVYHSKTKHIAIRHHFIRDAYEKKLIQVLKIHTDDNVADLLTKAFDVSRGLIEFGESLRRGIAGTETLLLPTLFILCLDKVSTDSENLVPLGKVCTALESKMAVLESCPKHNMVAYLEKSEGNAEFHEIIDFLKRSYIHHALTVSPIVSTTFVEQFWTSAKSKTINNVRHITAKVAGKSVSISEASIRSWRVLLQKDIEGIPHTISCSNTTTDLSPRPSPTPIIPLIMSQKTTSGGESWRKVAKGESSVQRDPLFDTIHEDSVDHMEIKNAQDEGRTREMVDEDKEIDEIRLSTEDVVSTDKEGVSTDRPIVSTNGSKISTDEHIEGTEVHIEGTEEHNEGTEKHIEGTEEQIESTDGQREGIEEKVESTDGQRKGTEDQTEEEIAAQATQTPTQTHTSTVFGDDETIAKFFQHESKPGSYRRKRKKGFEEIDSLLKRFKNKKGSNFTIEDKSKFLPLIQLMLKRSPLLNRDRELLRTNPPTKNQLRNQMMTYLKHVGNYKHAKLKIKKFEEVQALYEKIKRSDEDFISIGSAEDERLIKRINEKGVDSSKSEVIKEETKEEVQKESKEEESTRKRKLGTRKKMKSRKRRYIQNTSEDDSEKENDELRLHLKIAPDEEKEVDYEILDRKYPIKEWKRICLELNLRLIKLEH